MKYHSPYTVPGLAMNTVWDGTYLGLAIALHAVISQLMYGGYCIHIHAPIPEVRGGAETMYYGGDIAELLLAAALVATWRPDRRPRFASPVPTPYRPART